jgi:hypothetical protein
MNTVPCLPIHHLTGKVHGNVNDDHTEEQLEVFFYLRPDMHSGTYMHYTKTADTQADGDNDHIDKVPPGHIDIHIFAFPFFILR